MQRLKSNRLVVILGSLATGVGLTGGASAWEALEAPSQQATVAAPSVQGGPSAQTTTAAPQSQVAYQTVNTVECVQVPVTQMQTQYRTECRTVDVPVTRMVSEVVNEQRTITRFVPQQKTINRTVTHYECEPMTVTEKALPAGMCDQDGTTDPLSDVLHDRDREQADHAVRAGMCYRDGAGHEVPQGCRAAIVHRHPGDSDDHDGTRRHVRAHLRPQVRWRRLWLLRRRDDMCQLSARDHLHVPASAGYASGRPARARDDTGHADAANHEARA